MRFTLTLIALAIGSFAFGQSAEDLKRLDEFKKKVNMPVVFLPEGKQSIKVIENLSYKMPSESYAKLDIYQPAINGKKRPLIIFIHGKTPIATDPKSWGGYKSWGELTASKGFISVTFTHSLATPGKSIEDAGNDLGAVLNFLKAKHTTYNIDTTRIALIAYSAGVPLLSVAAFNKNPNIKCLVGFYGFMDLSGIEMWRSEKTKTLARFSLINYYADLPPILIARAGRENNKGLNSTIDSFVVKALSSNSSISFLNHPEGVHGFDTQNNDERTKEIVASLLVFLDYHLR